jgi:putative flippase GtrA
MATFTLNPVETQMRPNDAHDETADASTAGASSTRTPTTTVDIVIPVYNEEAGLRECVLALRDHLVHEFPFSWRITIADNASTDGTWALAEELASTVPGVRALHLDLKGRGRALRTAWTGNDAAVVAYMDVDLSTRLDALLPLIAPLVSGHSDVAIGSRLAPGATVARGPKREFISRTYNLILHLVFGNTFRDAQCGFKAIRTDVAQLLLPQVEDNAWFFDTELLILAERNGLRVTEVPVTWIDDPDSRVHVATTAKEDLKGVWRLARRFWAGKGQFDLGDQARPALTDDFGRQLVGFAKVGVLSTLVSLALFLALRHSTGAIWANLIAVGATALGNTWANRRWTFGYRGATGRGGQLVRGVAVALGGLALSTVAVSVFTASVPQVVALLVSWAVATVARFAVLRRWVFRTAA